MKAIQIVRPMCLRVIDIEKPVLNRDDDVLIKMTAAGICGSDVGIYHGTNAAATYPRIMGHEIVGVVDQVGKGVEKLKVGDRVIVDQVVNCGHCYACRKGRGNVCGELKVRGVHIDGGYREYISVPEEKCYLLPDSLSDIEAVMIEPTTIAIQSCSRAELQREDVLVIIGYGALGSTILKIARLSGARIIVADIVGAKLSDALRHGASEIIDLSIHDLDREVRRITGGYGSTVTIDAACTKTSLLDALKCTGNAGRVVTMGFSVEDTVVNQFLITSKELDVRGSRLQNRKFGEAIRLIREGKIDLHRIVSHTFPLTKAQEAFRFIDSKDSSIRKVVLTFDRC